MLQVEKTRAPPGRTSATATRSSLRWYAAVWSSSRSVWRCTSLQEGAGRGPGGGRQGKEMGRRWAWGERGIGHDAGAA